MVNFTQPLSSFAPSQVGHLRMDRYLKRVQNGKVKASPEVVKLWGTLAGRYLTFSIAYSVRYALLGC